jgi:hypothetical protein
MYNFRVVKTEVHHRNQSVTPAYILVPTLINTYLFIYLRPNERHNACKLQLQNISVHHQTTEHRLLKKLSLNDALIFHIWSPQTSWN